MHYLSCSPSLSPSPPAILARYVRIVSSHLATFHQRGRYVGRCILPGSSSMKGLSAWARDRCAPGISQANFTRDDEDDTASPGHYVPSIQRSDFRSDLHGHRQHGRATLEGTSPPTNPHIFSHRLTMLQCTTSYPPNNHAKRRPSSSCVISCTTGQTRTA